MTTAPKLPEYRKDGKAGVDRLWDSQWVNIVNAPDVLNAETPEEAVHLAVRMTEQKMAENFRALAHPSPGPAQPVACEAVRGLVDALKLALEYWQHRQQRYRNRHPAWVTAAREALSALAAEGVQAGEVEQRARENEDSLAWDAVRNDYQERAIARAEQPEARGVVRHDLCDCPNGRAEHSPSCAALTGERNG